MCAQALVIRVCHEIFGFVEVRPRGRGGPPVYLEHHVLVVSGLREYQRRRYTPQVVLLVIIAVYRKIDRKAFVLRYRIMI